MKTIGGYTIGTSPIRLSKYWVQRLKVIVEFSEMRTTGYGRKYNVLRGACLSIGEGDCSKRKTKGRCKKE